MENTFVHDHNISYKVRATENMNSLDVSLQINNGKSEAMYSVLLVDGVLPRDLRNTFKEVENIYQLMKDKKNYEVDLLQGKITLISKLKGREKRVEIVLRKTNEKMMEMEMKEEMDAIEEPRRKLSELKIKSDEFRQIKIEDDDILLFKSEILEFKSKFGKWKSELSEKIKLLEYTEVEESEEGSYEGQFRNRKKDGFGVLDYKNGDQYTGEWKNGKQHGLGIYRFSSYETL